MAQGMKISFLSYSFVSLQTYCPSVLQMGKLRLTVTDNFPGHRIPEIPIGAQLLDLPALWHECVLMCIFQGKERIHALPLVSHVLVFAVVGQGWSYKIAKSVA